MILNRLKKNLKKRKAWTKQANVQAFRLYDRDIPEYPFIVDVYHDHFLIYDKGRKEDEKDQTHLEELIECIKSDFCSNEEKIEVKTRRRLRNRQTENAQYRRLSREGKGSRFVVEEGDFKFWVNLKDYLDTGLFLDHRPLRSRIKKLAQAHFKDHQKPMKFLNLFCYTGAVSIAAAKGGAITHSIDMSNTYLDWAKDNFALNGFNENEHSFDRADVMSYLANPSEKMSEVEKYDVIYCDPPTFSNSKKMEESFEIEREQTFVIHACMNRLKALGTLFFSTNKRNFKLSPHLAEQYTVQNITQQSIPSDFHDQKIHSCFILKHKKGNATV